MIREREPGDIDRLVEIVESLHRSDGYPPIMPEDPASLFAIPELLGSWVWESGGCVVGHVALCHGGPENLMQLASRQTGIDVSGLAMVTRLFVDRGSHRGGVGRILLDTAAGRAVGLGLFPVLDVAVSLKSAQRLYEAAGWTMAGGLTHRFAGDAFLDVFAYLGPRTTPGR